MKHSLISILPDLEVAIEDLGRELQYLETEEARLLEAAKQTIGNLSDLRYGRFSNSQLREQVLDGLRNVEGACDKKT
jgi:centromere-localized protein 2